MSELQALEQLRGDVNHLSLTLALYEGEFAKAVDAEIERPKKKGDKGQREAIDAAFNAMSDYKQSLIDELEGAINLAKKLNLGTSSLRHLIEALRGGFDMPKPLQFIFSANVEIAEIIRVTESEIPAEQLKPNVIPPDKRTKPMSKTEALNHIGWPKHCQNERQAREWFSACIRDGEYRCEELNHKSFVFHVDDFPVEARKDVSKA